jgi:hypothetical protein
VTAIAPVPAPVGTVAGDIGFSAPVVESMLYCETVLPSLT